MSLPPTNNGIFALSCSYNNPNAQKSTNDSIQADANRQSTTNDNMKSSAKTAESLNYSSLSTEKDSFEIQEQSELFSTCKGPWPEYQTLGDVCHDNIIKLSNRLKLHLVQGEYEMIADTDPNHELYGLFKQDFMTIKPPKHSNNSVLSFKRTKSVLSVVGNRRNLTARDRKSPGTTAVQSKEPSFPSKSWKRAPKRPQIIQSTPIRSSHTQSTSSKTPIKSHSGLRKKRFPSAIPPDGKRFFLCEPCNKQYKNKNDLMYHLQRCKKREPFSKQEDQETSPMAKTVLVEENKDESLLQEFDFIEKLLDKDALCNLQSSNVVFSSSVDELYNLF
ncbi:hypothetical protein G6F43_008622 [Rhizopus delemar]|nr:hypothetical protein G6F43_008622 [Rhizopus delemar]